MYGNVCNQLEKKPSHRIEIHVKLRVIAVD